MNRKALFFAWLLLPVFHLQAGNPTPTLHAGLQSATVYPDGALLTHQASATLTKGYNELWLDEISSKVDINSIRLQAPGKLTVLSIRFSTDYLHEELTTPAISRLQDSLKNYQQSLDQCQLNMRNSSALLELLKANRQIAGSQTGLNVEELKKMMEYYGTQLAELEAGLLKSRYKEEMLRQRMELIRQQIKELETKNSKTGGRLLLQIMSPEPMNARLELTYFTPAASWTPYYDIRVNNLHEPVVLRYIARLQQTTGIDWKNIRLRLATARPREQQMAPDPQTWFLSYRRPPIISALQGKAAGVSLQEVVVVGYGSRGKSSADKEEESNEPLYIADGQPISPEAFRQIDPASILSIRKLQGSEATAIYGSRAANGVVVLTRKQGLEDQVSVTDNELSVSYDIDVPYSVASDGREQILSIKQEEVDASFRYFALPRQADQAFLLGSIAHWEALHLLPGEASIMVEGTYIGKTRIDPQSTSDSLQLSLGADKRLVVERKKLKDISSVKFLGSNKTQEFAYDLTVRNNKKEAVSLLLQEQIPVPMLKEIEVKLIDRAGADLDEEKGLLSWHLQLAPGESRTFKIRYSIRYPRDKQIDIRE